ncbi:hypothetical protein I3760_05G178300 [Carya illinoinensis]|nr:hypothetical protein I3760_05G178300 [Carya illinoinensis]
MEDCLWYLNNGCSRHISGDKTLFKKVETSHGGTVTFGDGSKVVIEEKGSIEIPRLPVLHDVLFVNGLKANLLSISQFCDNNFSVQFSKDECSLYDKGGEWVLKGTRTSDNCYGISPKPLEKCHRVTLDES